MLYYLSKSLSTRLPVPDADDDDDDDDLRVTCCSRLLSSSSSAEWHCLSGHTSNAK